MEGISACLSSGTASAYLYALYGESDYLPKAAHAANLGTAGFLLSTAAYALLYRYFGLTGLLSATVLAGAAGDRVPFASSLLTALVLTLFILAAILATLGASFLLSRTLLKGVPSSFTLELPPYRRPQPGKVIVRSIFDRTLFVLGRAVAVAAPAGLVIWLLANLTVGGESLLMHIAGPLPACSAWMASSSWPLSLAFPPMRSSCPLSSWPIYRAASLPPWTIKRPF